MNNCLHKDECDSGHAIVFVFCFRLPSLMHINKKKKLKSTYIIKVNSLLFETEQPFL